MPYAYNPLLGAGLDQTGASVSALNVLGTVLDEAALPSSANTTGDVYQAEDTGVFYVWDGSAWDNLGTLIGPQGSTGATGPTGPAGADGVDGTDGVGVPVGGTNGQALVKASNTDYDTEWADVTAVAALDDLTDVTLTSPSDGQVLEYDSATSTWVNATPSGGGGTPGGTTGQIQFNDNGSFGGATGSVVDSSGNVTIGGLTTLAGSPSANNTSGVLINGTWRTGASSNNPQLLLNPSGTTLSTSWSTSGTGIGVNAPSGFGGNLLDLQVNGTSRATLLNTGALLFTPPDNNPTQGLEFQTAAGGLNGYIRNVPNTGILSLSASVAVDVVTGLLYLNGDTKLYRDAANTLAQRNGTAAQTSRVYDTYTSSTDYHRIAIATARATLSNVSGASVTATGLIPAGAVVMGVTSKVTTGLGTTNGTTGYQIGIVGDEDRWGAITGTAAGTTSDNRDWTVGTIECFPGPSATDVIVTNTGGNFDGTGVIYLSVQYMAGEAD